MKEISLKRLHDSTALLLRDDGVLSAIMRLKEEIGSVAAPFLWSVIDQASFPPGLPGFVKSAWIFVLKRNVPSGCHYHPNSIQHMTVVEGAGRSIVGGETRRMIEYNSPDHSPAEIWYVIEEGVEHEFFPEGRDMVVISFHTCEARELEEISCATGESRIYEADRASGE